MENLAQIPTVKDKSKVAPRTAIMAMHRVVFEEDGDRNNRKRLREFPGCSFTDDSQEYREKLEYASRLSIGDLTSVCNILGLSYDGNKEQIRERIIRGLIDFNLLRGSSENDDIEESEEETEDAKEDEEERENANDNDAEIEEGEEDDGIGSGNRDARARPDGQ